MCRNAGTLGPSGRKSPRQDEAASRLAVSPAAPSHLAYASQSRVNPWPPHPYVSEGLSRGLPENHLREALRQAHNSQNRGYPAILSLKHLAVMTDVSYGDLREVVSRETDPYRSFRIRKRSGGRRLICVPRASLARVQKWLALYVLNRGDVHVSSAAYAPGSSPVKCAALHCGCRWLVKVDVRNFFESISEIQVYRTFRKFGYSTLVSFELTRLCTRVYIRKTRRRSDRVWEADPSRYDGIPAYGSWQIGHLPQGAPTSPMLSNLTMHALDSDLTSLAADAGLYYTRYADDLTFSTSEMSFSRVAARRLLSAVMERLRAEGLRANRQKTVIAPPGARKIVLGLLVDGSRPRLRREFKKSLGAHIHFLKRFGPAQHAERRGFKSIWSMRRHLQGKIAYARQVEPAFADEAERGLAGVDWSVLSDDG